MSLNIRSLSFKINVAHLFWGSTFAAGSHEMSNILNLFSIWGPAPKINRKHLFYKDKIEIFRLI